MVLMGIVGTLGAGKTLSLTYIAYRNYKQGVKIFSNYDLKFPYTPVNSINDIMNIQQGFFAADELWVWLDSRSSMRKRNMLIGNILLTSRKKGVNFSFTAQRLKNIDVRIRSVMDFIALPKMSPSGKVCRLFVFTYPDLNLIKSYKFLTEPIFELYDTNEIIDDFLPDE